VSRFRAKPSNLPAFVNEISRREMARTAAGIAAAIEHHLDAANALIAALDAMEGDCVLEETADIEPSLAGRAHSSATDCESDDDFAPAAQAA